MLYAMPVVPACSPARLGLPARRPQRKIRASVGGVGNIPESAREDFCLYHVHVREMRRICCRRWFFELCLVPVPRKFDAIAPTLGRLDHLVCTGHQKPCSRSIIEDVLCAESAKIAYNTVVRRISSWLAGKRTARNSLPWLVACGRLARCLHGRRRS